MAEALTWAEKIESEKEHIFHVTALLFSLFEYSGEGDEIAALEIAQILERLRALLMIGALMTEDQFEAGVNRVLRKWAGEPEMEGVA